MAEEEKKLEIGSADDDESQEAAHIERVNQQCFLVDNHAKYANPSINPNGFKNLTCMMGDPSDVLQRLSTRPGREAFLTLTNDKIAQLVPTIRLFRVPLDPVTRRAKTQRSKKKEIRFRTYYDPNVADITLDRSMRGEQVGLKEISYELVQGGGSDTVGRGQTIVLKFIADSIDALKKTDILDLVLHPQASVRKYDEGGNAIAGTKKPNLDFYAIQLVYGWSLPPAASRRTGDWRPHEIRAIKDSLNTLTLTLQGHELTYNDNGSVEITAEYNGYADARMSDFHTNILYSSQDRKDKIRTQQKEALEQEEKVAASKAAVEEAEKKRDKATEDYTKAMTGKSAFKALISASGKERTEQNKKVALARGEAERRKRHVEQAQKKREEEKERLLVQQRDLERALSADRQEKYSRILEELSDRGKVWYVDVDPETIGVSNRSNDWGATGGDVQKRRQYAKKTKEELDKMSPEDRAKYDKAREKALKARGVDTPPPKKHDAWGTHPVLSKAQQAVNKHTAGKVGEKNVAIANAKRKNNREKTHYDVIDSINANADDALNDANTKQAKERTKAAIGDFNAANTATAASSPDGGKLRINYVYWGDIFSIVLDQAYTAKGQSLPLRHLVGPINFEDPVTGQVRTVNLADIPISLNLFTTWWLKKIVGPNLDVYTVRQFVRDSINELIIAALGDDCYLGAGIKSAKKFGPVGGDSNRSPLEPPRLEYSTIVAPLGQGQKDRLANKGRLGLGADDIISYTKAQKSNDSQWREPENQVEYVFIYCNAWTKKDLTGTRAGDLKRGIYHINIGNDSGPVKKISFDKDESISEMMATQAQMDALGVRQLVASYNAKVSMVGNTMFVPLNYVYITPTALGFSPRLAHQMGLGGYYTVINISGKIDNSGWSTEMECRPMIQTASERAQRRAEGVVAEGTAGSENNSSSPSVKGG